MTDDDIRAHVMKAEGVLDQIQDKVTGQFGEARKAIMAIDRAYSQLLDSRDFYREARDELITDRDHWEHEAKEARAERDQAQEVADNALAHQNGLVLENAALRAGQGTWPEGESPAGEQVPRVISAEEVEVGQLLAVWGHDEPTGHPIHTIGVVSRIHDGSVLFEGGGMWFELIEDAKDDDCTIVLLADAPKSEPKRKRPHSAAFWAFDLSRGDLPDGEVAKNTDAVQMSHDPAPRLTVHALNTAPVGSRVTKPGRMPRMKLNDGHWFANWDHFTPESSEGMIRDGYANATLTYPKRGDHE